MLNESKGNMYPWITHTWNTVKGACPHDCSYCYMKRWGEQKPVRFDAKEIETDLGMGNYIFIGSSCDLFAEEISDGWIQDTIEHAMCFPKNRYLFQSKNPEKMLLSLRETFPDEWYAYRLSVCTTIETNRWYPEIMRKAPTPEDRAKSFSAFYSPQKRLVTIEPIMDFDLDKMVELIQLANPEQVNIGADSGNHRLPEPSADKVLNLIDELKKFTTIARKNNLGRILNKNYNIQEGGIK